ncbi:hypothetical protein V5O48_016349 [Marasmius crinis-equi]|uniref:Transcription factor domain-containing protein n=1 Tax=Marasmius crinis-equi TaxID=585013 RepID=A0ABR3ES03_9AGAR
MEGPCEYGDARTQAQVLERDIHRLEARLRQLQEPKIVESMELSDPYSSGKKQKARKKTSNGLYSLSACEPDISSQISRVLLDTFLAHAHDFAFFLNIPRFRDSLLLPLGHPLKPIRCLMGMIYLLGIRLATTGALPTPAQQAQQAGLLACVLDEVSSMPNTASSRPFVVVHTIQAELLLSTYLFCQGRQLEGQYHLTRAISLNIATRLNKIRSTRERPSTSIDTSIDDVTSEAQSRTIPSSLSTSPSSLPLTADPIDEGERINAFWTAFTLSNCWDAAVGGPTSLISVFGDGYVEVDTPWPMDMDGYEEGGFPPELRGSWTVQKFLNRVLDDTCIHDFSDVAMYAKASVLFRRARKIASQLQQGNGMPEHISTGLFDAFFAHSSLVNSFRESLPPISAAPTTPDRPTVAGMNLVTHALAHCSVIQLHSASIETNQLSMVQSIMAATACVEILSNTEVEKYLKQTRRLNPVMGILCGLVCDVFLKCLAALRNCGDTLSFMAEAFAVEAQYLDGNVAAMLEKLLGMMQTFAPRSGTMRNSLNKSLASYRTLNGDAEVVSQ